MTERILSHRQNFDTFGGIPLSFFIEDPSIREREKTELQTKTLLQRHFRNLPVPRVEEIVDGVASTFGTEQTPHAAQLVRTLFMADSSNSFTSGLRRQNISYNEFGALLHSDGVTPLMKAMLETPMRYRFQLGLAFSQQPLDEFSDEVKEKFEPFKVTTDVHLKSAHERWFLCREVEQILNDSIADTAIMTMTAQDTPLLLFNTRVKMQAVCLQDFMTPEGNVFIRGNMYCPTDTSERTKLEELFIGDHGVIPLPVSTWAFMRPVTIDRGRSIDEYLDHLTTAALEVPISYPNTTIVVGKEAITREEYRKIGKEDYL